MSAADTQIAVIGCGAMGRGIAYVAAVANYDVALFDSRAETLAQSPAAIAALLERGIDRGAVPALQRAAILGRIRTAASLEAAVRHAGIVIEAVVEDLAVKQRVFGDVALAAPHDALLATNTSSLSIAAIAAATRAPERIVGMHFFNPVPAMRLVEIISHDGTTRAVLDRALGFVRQLGKEPIVVRDSPGFASSRLGVALGLEAMRMLEERVASAEDIDKAMELGYNHPMGPLKLSDLIGLDVRLAIAEYLHRSLEDARFEPPRILRDKVAKGELGKKSGRGFYVWSG